MLTTPNSVNQYAQIQNTIWSAMFSGLVKWKSLTCHHVGSTWFPSFKMAWTAKQDNGLETKLSAVLMNSNLILTRFWRQCLMNQKLVEVTLQVPVMLSLPKPHIELLIISEEQNLGIRFPILILLFFVSNWRADTKYWLYKCFLVC